MQYVVMPTAAHKLADALLPVPLSEYVTIRRTSVPRWSWRLIAEHLASDTNGAVAVSEETLRVWFADVDQRQVA